MKLFLTFLLKVLVKLTAGLAAYQRLYQYMYQASLKGMTYGTSESIEDSGEIENLRYLRSKMSERCVIFDVGANQGLFAERILKHFPDTVKIYCFEPQAAVFGHLKTRFEFKSNVHCYPFGLSDQNTTTTIYGSEIHSSLSSVYNRRLQHFNIEMVPQEEIQLKSIETFCIENNISEIHLLKIDVEGHEYAVLNGCKGLLQNKSIKYIQFEFGGAAIDSRIFFQDFWYLLNENYSLYRIVKNGLHPIAEYSEDLEIFKTANYLAELK